MKKKLLLLTGLFMALSLSVTACGKAPSDDKTTAVESETNTEQLSEQAPPDSEKTTEITETESEEEIIYHIGEAASLKDWSITITDVKVVDSISSDYMIFEPKEEGNKFAQLFLTAENKGKQADKFLPSFAYDEDVYVQLLYGEGYEFSATQLLGYDNDIYDSTINPLSSQTGEAIFEIPDSVASASDPVFIKFISGNDSVQFQIR